MSDIRYGSVAQRWSERRTAADIAAARGWIADCSWTNLTEDEDHAELTGEQVRAGIERHYVGGWAQFLKDHEEASP